MVVPAFRVAVPTYAGQTATDSTNAGYPAALYPAFAGSSVALPADPTPSIACSPCWLHLLHLKPRVSL